MKVNTITSTDIPLTGNILVDSEVQLVGRVTFVALTNVTLRTDEKECMLTPGRYSMDIKNPIVLSVTGMNCAFIESYKDLPEIPKNVPVPDIPDMAEDSRMQLMEMVAEILRDRGYTRTDDEVLDGDNDDVILDTHSLEETTQEPSLSTDEPEPVETIEPETVSSEPVVTEDTTEPAQN